MTISAQIIEVLQFLASKFGVVIDWATEDIFPYVQTLSEHLIKWCMTKSLFAVSFSAIIVIISLIVFIVNVAKYNKTCSDTYCFISVAAVFIFIIGVVVFIIYALDYIKCVNFPELKVYEYVKDFISKN